MRIDAEYAREIERRAPLNYISGDYTPGRYVWVLEGVRALERPVPARGMLGLWNWEPNGV